MHMEGIGRTFAELKRRSARKNAPLKSVFSSALVYFPSRIQSLGTPYSSMAQTECESIVCNLYNPLELFDRSSRSLKVHHLD
jgi:hypothetical protein